MKKYILVGKTPVIVTDVEVWGLFFASPDRIVAKTIVEERIEVSTVFLGLDHNFSGVGLPILFETMIFGGDRDQHQRRYCTWEEAAKGHEEAVEAARDMLRINKRITEIINQPEEEQEKESRDDGAATLEDPV